MSKRQVFGLTHMGQRTDPLQQIIADGLVDVDERDRPFARTHAAQVEIGDRNFST